MLSCFLGNLEMCDKFLFSQIQMFFFSFRYGTFSIITSRKFLLSQEKIETKSESVATVQHHARSKQARKEQQSSSTRTCTAATSFPARFISLWMQRCNNFPVAQRGLRSSCSSLCVCCVFIQEKWNHNYQYCSRDALFRGRPNLKTVYEKERGRARRTNSFAYCLG